MQPDGMEASQGRRPANVSEAAFFDLAAENGWMLTKRGWPDFFLERNGSVICVEVKPPGNRNLRRDQARVQGFLAMLGVPCYVWSPHGGLEPVGGRGNVVESTDTARALELCAVAVLGEKEKGQKGVQGASVGGDSASAGPLEAATSLPSRPETSRTIERVWTAYVAAMKPRRTAAGDEERLVIRRALKVATPEELIACIQSCAESDYHMKRGEHANRRGGKYNALAKILGPRPRLNETQRSRIDWWLDKKTPGVAGFPSADPAIVHQRQLEVRHGHRSDRPETMRKAEDAKAWLLTHGIETIIRESDDYPVFRRVDARENS